MKELRGDLFEPSTYHFDNGMIKWIGTPDAIVITTNGFVKKNGSAVMGRGCAKRAAELMPGLPEILGMAIQTDHVVWSHGPYNGMNLVTFPVKPRHSRCNHDKSNVVKHMQGQFKNGDVVPGWACIADPLLIERSAKQLVTMADNNNWHNVILPRPGCGAGELKWEFVKQILDPILDDRFYCITF